MKRLALISFLLLVGTVAQGAGRDGGRCSGIAQSLHQRDRADEGPG